MSRMAITRIFLRRHECPPWWRNPFGLVLSKCMERKVIIHPVAVEDFITVSCVRCGKTGTVTGREVVAEISRGSY